MGIRFLCPSCTQKIKVPESSIGRRIRCSRCSGTISIPVVKIHEGPELVVLSPHDVEQGFSRWKVILNAGFVLLLLAIPAALGGLYLSNCADRENAEITKAKEQQKEELARIAKSKAEEQLRNEKLAQELRKAQAAQEEARFEAILLAARVKAEQALRESEATRVEDSKTRQSKPEADTRASEVNSNQRADNKAKATAQ